MDKKPRKRGEWSLSNVQEIIEKAPNGTKLKTFKLDKNVVLMHIKIPDAAKREDAEKWLLNLKKHLPDNVLVTITPHGYSVNVHRPSKVSINIRDSVFQQPLEKDFASTLEQIFKKSGAVHFNINFQNCKFVKNKFDVINASSPEAEPAVETKETDKENELEKDRFECSFQLGSTTDSKEQS